MRTVTVTYDDDRWVVYQYVQLDEIEHAYAVTVHKSQGSEYPIVILPDDLVPAGACDAEPAIYGDHPRQKTGLYRRQSGLFACDD